MFRKQSDSMPARTSEVVSMVQDVGIPDVTYPEGGWRAWGVVLGSFCIMSLLFGIINSAAIFKSYFRENQLISKSATAIGWIFLVYLFVAYLLGLVAGPIFDCYDHRYLVLVGSFFMVSGLLLLSFSTGKERNSRQG